MKTFDWRGFFHTGSVLAVSLLLASTAFLLPSSLLTAESLTYEILPADGARFTLEVFKTRLMSGKKHLFVAQRYRGQLAYEAAAPEKSQVAITVEAASLICQDDWVKPKDLKKIQDLTFSEMLAVDRYAEITFRARSIRPQGDGKFEVEGDLTIRGITRPVLLRATLKPGTNGELRIAGSSTVKMTDYGLKPPSAAFGMIGTKDEMAVSFDLRARRFGEKFRGADEAPSTATSNK